MSKPCKRCPRHETWRVRPVTYSWRARGQPRPTWRSVTCATSRCLWLLRSFSAATPTCRRCESIPCAVRRVGRGLEPCVRGAGDHRGSRRVGRHGARLAEARAGRVRRDTHVAGARQFRGGIGSGGAGRGPNFYEGTASRCQKAFLHDVRRIVVTDQAAGEPGVQDAGGSRRVRDLTARYRCRSATNRSRTCALRRTLSPTDAFRGVRALSVPPPAGGRPRI
jgi:hypothetical protein